MLPALYAVSVPMKVVPYRYVPVAPIEAVITLCTTVAAKMEEDTPIAIVGVRGVVSWSVTTDQRMGGGRATVLPCRVPHLHHRQGKFEVLTS